MDGRIGVWPRRPVVNQQNGNVLITYMGTKNLTTPGGLVEIGLDGTVVAEYAAARPGGPTR